MFFILLYSFFFFFFKQKTAYEVRISDWFRRVLFRSVRLSIGEEEAGGRENPAILADVCEAIIGALFRDAGLETARAFIVRQWQARLEGEIHPPQDAKTTLQEWAQQRGRPLPLYRTVGRSGPDHAPAFTISVEGEGRSEEHT